MKSPETILTSIGRSFLQSLPRDVTQQTPTSVNHHFHLTDENFGDLFLSGPQSDQFMACIEEVGKQLLPLWDEKTLFNLTGKMVLQGVDPKQFGGPMKTSRRHTHALNVWVAAMLIPPATWELYFGVLNISAQGLPITIGNVTFIALDAAGKNEILSRFDEVAAISPDSAAIKRMGRERVEADLEQDSSKFAVRLSAASVSVKANTSSAAAALGLREVRRTLDVLNFYADLIHVQPTVVYLPGDASRAGQCIVAFKRGDAGTMIAASHTTKISGVWSAMGLFDPHLQEAKNRGFDRACLLLSLQSPNDVDSRVLAALRWVGQAAADSAIKRDYQEDLDSEREQSFLFYAISLESLFCKRREYGEGGATRRLSSRTAHLLCANAADRAAYTKKVEKLYDRRSEIVHQGGLRVSEQELKDIRFYASAAIIEMLTNPQLIALSTEEEFDQWFAE